MRFSPRKIPFPSCGIESAQMTQSAKKINCRAKSAAHIILFPFVTTILDKRAAIISRPFVGAFQLIFKMFLCPANFHSRETERAFVVLPQFASQTGLIFDSFGDKRMPPACIAPLRGSQIVGNFKHMRSPAERLITVPCDAYSNDCDNQWHKCLAYHQTAQSKLTFSPHRKFPSAVRH